MASGLWKVDTHGGVWGWLEGRRPTRALPTPTRKWGAPSLLCLRGPRPRLWFGLRTVVCER